MNEELPDVADFFSGGNTLWMNTSLTSDETECELNKI